MKLQTPICPVRPPQTAIGRCLRTATTWNFAGERARLGGRFRRRARFVPKGQPEISQTRSVWFTAQSKSVLKGRRKPSSFQDGQIHRTRYQPLRSWLISMRRAATHRSSRTNPAYKFNSSLPRSPTPNCHWLGLGRWQPDGMAFSRGRLLGHKMGKPLIKNWFLPPKSVF